MKIDFSERQIHNPLKRCLTENNFVRFSSGRVVLVVYFVLILDGLFFMRKSQHVWNKPILWHDPYGHAHTIVKLLICVGPNGLTRAGPEKTRPALHSHDFVVYVLRQSSTRMLISSSLLRINNCNNELTSPNFPPPHLKQKHKPPKNFVLYIIEGNVSFIWNQKRNLKNKTVKLVNIHYSRQT